MLVSALRRTFQMGIEKKASTKRSKRAARRTLRLESLERREVFAVDLQSVFGIGNFSQVSTTGAITTDSAGNQYVAGTFGGTVDFDPNVTLPGNADVLTSLGQDDAYVAKYNASNQLIWVRQMGGELDISTQVISTLASNIKLDSAGNIIVSGAFYGTANFGTTMLTSLGGRDAFLTKLDASGNFLWSSRSGTADKDDLGIALEIDSKGNIYTLTDRLFTGREVQKWSPQGNLAWSRYFADRATLVGDLAIAANGNILIGSSLQGTLDFDPSARTYFVSSVNPAAYLLSLTSNGGFSSIVLFTATNGSGISALNSVETDNAGNTYVAGFYTGNVDFDPGRSVVNLPNTGAFVAKLNKSNNLVWAKGIQRTGGSGSVLVAGLELDNFGNLFMLGNYTGMTTVDFNPDAGVETRTNPIDSDIYLLNLTTNGAYVGVDTFSGTNREVAQDLHIGSDGSIYITGYFKGAVDFNADPLVNNSLQNANVFNSGFVARFRRR